MHQSLNLAQSHATNAHRREGWKKSNIHSQSFFLLVSENTLHWGFQFSEMVSIDFLYWSMMTRYFTRVLWNWDGDYKSNEFESQNQKWKMTGGTLAVRSDKSLTLLAFDIWFLTFDIWHLTYDIWHSTNGPMDQRTDGPMDHGPMDQRTNGPMDQWTNGPMDQWTKGPMDQWTNGPMNQWTNGPMDQ